MKLFVYFVYSVVRFSLQPLAFSLSFRSRRLPFSLQPLAFSLLFSLQPLAFSLFLVSPVLAQDSLPDLRLGPFDFQPRLGLGATYDDNILISSDNTQSDLIWSIYPAVLTVAGDRLAIEDFRRQYYNVVGFTPDTFIVADRATWPGPTFILDYGPRFNLFTEHDENNSVDQLLDATLLWPLNKIIFGVQQDYYLQNTTIIEAGQRTDQEILRTDLSAAYQFSDKTSADLDLRRTSYDYEADRLNGYTDWSANAFANYQLYPRLNTGLGFVAGYLDVDPSSATTTPSPDQTYQQVLARARYQFAERISADASAGLQLRQFDSDHSDTLEPVFNAAGYYRPTDTLLLSLAAYRRETASVYSGANYIDTGVALGARQRFAERYFASLTLGYDNLDYLATSRTTVGSRVDDYFTVRAGLEVRFTRHLIANAFYLFRTLDSNQFDGFNNHQVGLQVTLLY